MQEFNLKVFFEMYKDSPIVSRNNFRRRFHKKHGKFQYLPELIFMIEQYQHKKYDNLVDDFMDYAPSKKNRKGRKSKYV